MFTFEATKSYLGHKALLSLTFISFILLFPLVICCSIESSDFCYYLDSSLIKCKCEKHQLFTMSYHWLNIVS